MARSQRLLVVGGGQGIGWEAVKAALRYSSEAQIFIFGLHIEKEIWSLPERREGRVFILEGDVTDERVRRSVIDNCVMEMGGIDTLVFTAGVITPIERIEKVNMDEVKRAFDINVFGCMAMVCMVRK
jgi:NAD(P)-dependent dehydrogenase (short-subunit alcohol dehydrogenase family)